MESDRPWRSEFERKLDGLCSNFLRNGNAKDLKRFMEKIPAGVFDFEVFFFI